MRDQSLSRLLLLAPLLVAIAALGSAQPAGAPLKDAPKTPAVTTEKSGQPAPPADVAARRARNNSEFLVALGLWCAIVVAGLLLLVIVVTWGRSLRNLARRKPKPPSAPDPLWYLKTKPPAAPTPAASAGESARRPDDGDPGTDVSSRTPQ